MKPRGRATPMCFPFPSQRKLQQIHREQTDKLPRACFTFGGCTGSYWDCSCWKLKALQFPLSIREVLTSYRTLPEGLPTHNTTVSICLLRYHQPSKNSLNMVTRVLCCAQCVLCPCIYPYTCTAFLLVPRNKPRSMFLLRLHLLWEAACKLSAKQTWRSQGQKKHNQVPSGHGAVGNYGGRSINKLHMPVQCMRAHSKGWIRGALMPGYCSRTGEREN